MTAAMPMPIHKSRDRKIERGPKASTPRVSAIAHIAMLNFVSNAKPATAPAHQYERGSFRTNARTRKYATAVKSIGSNVDVESVELIAIIIVLVAAATATSHAPRVVAPSSFAK